MKDKIEFARWAGKWEMRNYWNVFSAFLATTLYLHHLMLKTRPPPHGGAEVKIHANKVISSLIFCAKGIIE